MTAINLQVYLEPGKVDGRTPRGNRTPWGHGPCFAAHALANTVDLDQLQRLCG